ncbi:hypothetical protein [Caudoviricetes sp.]|nr:hypothetical protein [Caudoviricetes sp.]
MPVYEFQGKHYELSETDPSVAKSKIQAALGQPTQPTSGVDTGVIGQTKAVGKSAFEKTGEAAGGWYGAVSGAETGAALGTLGGPLAELTVPAGAVIGGIVGGFGGGFVGDIAQQAVGKLIPESVKQSLGFGEEQRAAEKEAMPIATKIGEAIPAVASLAVPTKAFSEGVNKFIANKLWTEASPIQQQSLKTAESWGLKVKPSQVQEGAAQKIVGSKENQLIMNQKAAEATGYAGKTTHVDENFLKGRFTDLGNQYEKIYGSKEAPKAFKLDNTASDSITAVLNNKDIPLSARLRSNLIKLTSEPDVTRYTVSGDDFRKVISDLKKISMDSTSGSIRYDAQDLVSKLNESLATNNKEIKAALDLINPKYRATATLSKSFEKGIIDKNGNLDAHSLGKYLRNDKTNPLYEVGSVGESLGISSISKGAKRVGGGEEKGLSKLISPTGLKSIASDISDVGADTAAGKMIQQKARGEYVPQNAFERLIQNYTARLSPAAIKLMETMNEGQ